LMWSGGPLCDRPTGLPPDVPHRCPPPENRKSLSKAALVKIAERRPICCWHQVPPPLPDMRWHLVLPVHPLCDESAVRLMKDQFIEDLARGSKLDSEAF